MYFDLFKPKEPQSPMMVKLARVGIPLSTIEEKDVEKLKAAAESYKTATQEQSWRTQKFADLRAKADKRTWETETKPKDDFLEGFYYYDEGQKLQPEEDSLRKQINKTRQVLDFVPNFQFPVDYGAYRFINRNDIYSKMQGEASKSVRKPTGQFGVGLKSSPTVAIKNGKADATYVFGFDTEYIDEKGNLKPLEIPQWHFDRDAIKSHNAQRIDSVADTLASRANLEKKAEIYGKAEALKENQALKVDEIAKKWEGRLNSADALSKRSKVNRMIAETTEKLPKILDSGAAKALKTGGKAVSVAGDVLNAANVGLTVVADYKDDGRLGKTSAKAAAGLVGDIGGSALGAKIGAMALGALGGAFSGGVFAAPLAAVGGILGGFIGGYVGGDAAEGLVELMY